MSRSGLVGFIPFGNVAGWNIFGDLALRHIARLRNLFLRVARHPHVEDAAVASRAAEDSPSRCTSMGMVATRT